MLYPLIMCALAGLSTGIGGLIVAFTGIPDDRKMAFSQGFAAGVMLAVSVMDLLPETFATYYVYMPFVTAIKAVLALFFCGWTAGAATASMVIKDNAADSDIVHTVRRTAAITIMVMVMHNLPEGILTVFSSSHSMEKGIKITMAVALHNLPEGIAVASPVLYLTGKSVKAFAYSLLTGMAELAGGVTAYFLLKGIMTPALLNGIMPVVAGVMCQAAICEMIPAGGKISDFQHTLYGIITGILAMSIGLFMF